MIYMLKPTHVSILYEVCLAYNPSALSLRRATA